MSAWTIYLFTRLDTFQCFGAVAGILSGIAAIILGVCYYVLRRGEEYNQEIARQVKPFYRFAMIICLCTLPIALLLPSSKEFAAIYLIPRIVNNEQVQQIPSKGLTLLNEKLDQWIDDLRKGKENSK